MATYLAGSSTMVSVSPQSPLFHSFKHKPANNGFFYSKSRKNCSFFKTLKPSSSSSSSSSPNSEPQNLSNEPQGQKPDPVKLAFKKAKAYRKSVQAGSNPVLKIVQSSVSEPGGLGSESDKPASEFVADRNGVANENELSSDTS